MTPFADMTDTTLPRPASAAEPGPLDERFYELVEARFRRLMQRQPGRRDLLRHP